MASMQHSRLSLAISLAAGFAFVPPALAEPAVDFNRDIRPILSNKCYACHGPDDGKREAGLRFDDPIIATHALDDGATAIIAGKPNESELVRRITSADPAERMPPAKFGKPLSKQEITTLTNWIQQG